MAKRVLFLVLMPLLVASFHQAKSQVEVDTSYTADHLVKEILLGSGVLVGNVKYTGEKFAISSYEDPTKEIGISKGILLTSGNVFYALGPNKTPRSGWASSAKGDEELEAIARGKTWDAAVLEFDFVTVSEHLSFRYVFASEEYLEYVGSKFNDVFGFFISGEDVTKVNIAMLPDGITPITVNTVNNELNENYYIDNTYFNATDPFIWDVQNRKVITNKDYQQPEIPPKYNIQFDGFTNVLEAKYEVIPNKVYHIKLAIADVGDDILDSGVFLEASSFQSYGDQIVELDDHFNTKTIAAKIPIVTPKSIVNKEPKRVEIPKQQKFGQIEFEFDEYHLSPMALSTIVRIYNQWKTTSKASIQVIGHTDDWGSLEYNQSLSKNRSQSVADMLEELGVPKNLIVIEYHGETSPISDNHTSEGRARNRRVEFYLNY